jgi:tRNA threonylcarbamoyladenosine biosynthesis protein TsaE
MKHRPNKIVTNSATETKQLAAQLASSLNPGDVLALEGDLGSGKTQFVQGLARGLGVPENGYVRSPSFTLLNEYRGRYPLYHFDFYRLHEASALDDLGLEEYFDGHGITVIEWADRFPGALPERTIHIKFEIIDETRRSIEIKHPLCKHARRSLGEGGGRLGGVDL